MSLVRPIQPAFSGGEVSPSLWPRVDIAKYGTCLRRCRNFIIHPTGGASNRPGTVYVASAKNTDKKVRVKEFIFNDDQTYVFEFGDHYIRFYTSGSRINVTPGDYDAWTTTATYAVNDYVTYAGATTYLCIQAGTNKNPSTETDYWTQQLIYEIYSPYGEDDLASLNFESSADVVFITSNDFQTRTLSRYGNTDFRLELYAPDDGPFMAENTDETITLSANAVSGSVTLSSTAAVFDADHVGALWKLRHYIEGQSVSQAFTSVTAGTSIKCFTTWRLITHGTWTGKFDIEKSIDGGTTWTVLRSFSGADDYNANTYGTESVEDNEVPFLVRINFTDYTSGTANVDLSTDPFYQEGIVRITKFNNATSVDATVLQEIGSTDGTLSWNEGAWSEYRGWPRVSRFYQDRLVFVGSTDEPMTGWMTKTGDYYSFVRHSTLLDSDGITFDVPGRQLNSINGLVAFKRLLVFTSSSVCSVGPVSGSGMTPTGYTTEFEEYNGSNGINPVVIGNEAFYVQEHGQVINNIGYSIQSEGFTGNIANIMASHLFINHEIIDMVYQRNPDHIIWCLRDDGVLIGLTYIKEQEVVAWHWHDTRGTIQSICVIPSGGFDELWMSVERENGVFIEKLSRRLKPNSSSAVDIADQIFMDSAMSFTSAATITGITHLEGQAVSIIDGGEVLDQEIVEDGEISLTMSANSSTVHVGLPYFSDLETLNIELAMKDGTMQGKKVKVGNVMFRVIDTRGGWIGPNSNILYEAFPDAIQSKRDLEVKFYEDESILNYDDPSIFYDGTVDPLSLFTGDIRMPLGAGYEDGGRLFYRQKDPLPVTISAIVPELSVGGVAS